MDLPPPPSDTFITMLSETEIHLKMKVGSSIGKEVPSDLFSELFGLISEFVHSFNHRNLSDVIELLMEKEIEMAFVNQGNGRLQDYSPAWRRCFSNVSIGLVQPYKKAMMPRIEKQLADIALFVDALNTFRHTMKVVQDHSFSPTCIATLTRLKYCAYCGGYSEYKPCPFLCMNTFRGCVEDIARLNPSYKAFVTALTEFSHKLSNELQPEFLIQNSLSQLVLLAKHFSGTSLKERVMTAHAIIHNYIFQYPYNT